jgi:hypothetical protein
VNITTVTPPASEPVTLSEAKLWARVDHDAEDSLITSLIVAAREAAENFTRRAFVTQTLRLSVGLPHTRVPWVPGYFEMPESALYGTIPNSILLPRPPVAAISGVTTYDTANSGTAFTGYALINDRLVLNSGAYWPTGMRTEGAVEITYTAGYGTASAVPSAIKSAIKMHVQAMYDGRTVCEMPASCQQLLRQFKVYGDLR